MGDSVKVKFIECYKKQETISKKVKLLKLYDLYKRFINVNYISEEEELYKVCRESQKEKIKLEIKRIINVLSKDGTNYDAINKAILMSDEIEIMDFDSETVVKNMFNRIIDLELDLDIPIGLYKETIEYFLQKINQHKTDIFDYNFKDDSDNINDVIVDVDDSYSKRLSSYYYKFNEKKENNNKRK